MWSAQGFIVLCWLLVIPTDTENPLAFGFSTARLILLAVALLVIVSSVLLWTQSNKPAAYQNGFDLDQHIARWDVLYIVALLISLGAPIFIITLNSIQENPLYSVYASRLLPLLVWFGISSVELALFIAWHRHQEIVNTLRVFRPLWKKAFFLFIAFIFIGIWIAVTKVGVASDDRNLGSPGIPLFEWQILLVLFVISLFAFLPRNNFILNDKWIILGVYILTLVLWLAQPMNPGYSATPPRAPAFEIFPFSDPLIYAQSAQAALVGGGFLWPQVPARPFYIAFLTWLHLFGGQNYDNVIILQTLVFAIFPVILYLIGREFGGRPLGLGLSLIAILRDVNTNAVVSFANNYTYSKLFLSELPTALLLCLVTLLSIRWMRLNDQAIWRPLLIGGLLGTAMLIRTQSAILFVPIVTLAFFVISRSNRKQWLLGSVFIALGIVLTFTPWLVRNYIATGGFVIDNPLSQTVTLARRWSGYTGEEILARLPEETDAQYSSRAANIAIDAFKENYAFIFQTAANHFVNNEITSLLVFPARDQILSISELVSPQHAFWKTPLSKNQLLPFVFYLFLFSVGVATAWQQYRLAGMLPLIIHLTYNLWTSLFFSSGDRFIFPVDWGIYLYQLFGLIVLGAFLLLFVSGARVNISIWVNGILDNSPTVQGFDIHPRNRFVPTLILVLFLGAFLPITESIFPQKYPLIAQGEIIKQIGQMPESGEIAIYGRAIYPRYYGAGEGEPGTAKLGYGKSKEARLVFFVVGSESALVIFELKDVPDFFPHASDVFMIGTQKDKYFSPRIVKVTKDGQSELYINK